MKKFGRKQTMKICLIVATTGRSGVESVVFTLAQGLKFAGVQTHVLMFSKGPLTDLLCAHLVDYKIIHVTHKFDVIKILSLYQYFKKNKFDVIHVHGARAAFFSSIAALLCKFTNLIVSIHELSNGTYRNTLVRSLENTIYRWSFSKCISVSKAVAKDAITVRGISLSKIITIPNCLPSTFSESISNTYNLNMFKENMQSDLLVGSVGRLEAIKGHRYLIQAWPLIKNKFPTAKLKIAGAGPLEPELIKMSLELGVQPMVEFCGSIDNIVQFYSALDLLVVPSLSESFGITILEAMSCSIPVIASDVGGVSEIIKHEWNGLLVPSGDPTAIAQSILRLSRDNELRRNIILNGLKTIKSYSEKIFISKHMEVYRSFLRESKSDRAI